MALAEDAENAEDLDLEERVDDAVDVVLGRVPGEHEVLERGDQRRRVPPQLGWKGGEEEGAVVLITPITITVVVNVTTTFTTLQFQEFFEKSKKYI